MNQALSIDAAAKPRTQLKPLKIGNVDIGFPVVQAALSGFSDLPMRVIARRRRLSDVSWYMRCLAENIARRSNAEDQVRGHFFEGRFRAQLLLDEASLLACAA